MCLCVGFSDQRVIGVKPSLFLSFSILIWVSYLRIVSHLQKKSPLVKSIMDRCEILSLHKTLLSESGSGASDDFDDEFPTASVPAIRKDGFCVGRYSGGLAIFREKSFKTLLIHVLNLVIELWVLSLELKDKHASFWMSTIFITIEI